MKLSKEKIIDESFLLLNEAGLNKFNMRVLADRLSVSATALYWHFKNKDELFMHMVSCFYQSAYAALDNSKGWQSSLLELGFTLKKEMVACRDSSRLMASTQPLKMSSELFDQQITAPLIEQGLDRESALFFESAVICYVLGWVQLSQNQPLHDYLTDMFDFDSSFEPGLIALVDGFTVKLEKRSNAITIDN